MSIILSGREKKELRGQGQRLKACAQVGKGGLAPGVVETISAFFTHNPLIKIKLPSVDATERKRLAESLAELTESVLIATVGRTALLYRPAKDPTPEKSS